MKPSTVVLHAAPTIRQANINRVNTHRTTLPTIPHHQAQRLNRADTSTMQDLLTKATRLQTIFTQAISATTAGTTTQKM